jgi:hypothetical protein
MVVCQLMLEQSSTVRANLLVMSVQGLSGSLFCSTETAGCDYLAPIMKGKRENEIFCFV